MFFRHFDDRIKGGIPSLTLRSWALGSAGFSDRLNVKLWDLERGDCQPPLWNI
jgi:hypothetical protein